MSYYFYKFFPAPASPVNPGTLPFTQWPTISQLIPEDEVVTIVPNHQMLVFDEIFLDGGELILEGELAIIGSDYTDWAMVKENMVIEDELWIPEGYQVIVDGSLDVIGTLNAEGTVVIL